MITENKDCTFSEVIPKKTAKLERGHEPSDHVVVLTEVVPWKDINFKTAFVKLTDFCQICGLLSGSPYAIFFDSLTDEHIKVMYHACDACQSAHNETARNLAAMLTKFHYVTSLTGKVIPISDPDTREPVSVVVRGMSEITKSGPTAPLSRPSGAGAPEDTMSGLAPSHRGLPGTGVPEGKGNWILKTSVTVTDAKGRSREKIYTVPLAEFRKLKPEFADMTVTVTKFR